MKQQSKETTMTKTRILLTAALLSAMISGAHAQTPAKPGTDPHHPSGTTAPAMPASPNAATPGAMIPGQAGPMAGQPGGMMGGDMGAMMQSMMPMMRMMMARGAMERMDGPMGMMAPERIEGRVAFLKTELKVSDAQLPQWNALADVMRHNAKAMLEMRGTMMPAAAMPPPMPMSAPDRAQQHVKSLAAQLDSAKATATATRAFYDVLSDSQKKTADELLAPPMGRM